MSGKAAAVVPIREYNPHLGNKDEVIQANLRLVHKMTNRFRWALQKLNISYDDLFSEGCIGLMKAFDHYDPTKFEGNVTKFSTYAVAKIIGEIQRYIRDKSHMIRAPRKVLQMAPKVSRLLADGMDMLSIAEELHCHIKEVEDAMGYLEITKIMALEQDLYNSDDPVTIQDVTGTEQDFTEIHADEFLQSLPQAHREIVQLRMHGYTQLEIAKRVGFSQVQVSRVLTGLKERLMEKSDSDRDSNTGRSDEMIIAIDLNGKQFQKGDVIRLGSSDKDRMYLVGFSPNINRAYGIKLTRDCQIDSRCKLNEQGWNMTASFDQLIQSKVLLSDLSLGEIGLEESEGKRSVKEDHSEKKKEVSTRMATPDEIKKHGIKTILDQAEWFIDTKMPIIPSISLNSIGISFNDTAMKEMCLQAGDHLEVGFVKGQLVFRKGNRGLQLRKSKERRGLILVNKRLVSWIREKNIKSKRYALELDQLSGVWTSKYETVDDEKIAN